MAYQLGTILRWAYTNQFGTLNAGGKLHFYRNVAKDQTKTVYQDSAGLIPYPNPITLDAVGSVGLIYFNDDEPYYITLYDSTDTQLIWDVENYVPTGGGGGGGGSTEIDYTNFVINGQFRFINQLTFNTLSDSETNIAPYWYFNKSNTTATDTIQFLKFPVGTTTPPFSPTYYLRYNCSNVPSGETYKDLYIKIKDVNAFQDKQITISVEQQGTNPAQLLEFRYLQHFGTGGTPSADVEGAIATHNVNATWGKVSSTTTLPSIAGKTLGTNEDDYLAIIIRLPLDATTQVDITNFQINLGSNILDYEFQTYDKANDEKLAITNVVPYKYIQGLTTSTSSPFDSVNIEAGSCTDSTSSRLYNILPITKYITSVWAKGTGNGGLASGLSLTQDTWYHLFILMKNYGNDTDAGFDTDLNASNLLADSNVQDDGYTKYRRIASLRSDSVDPYLRSYSQVGDYFEYNADLKSDTTLEDTGLFISHDFTCDTPLGFEVEGYFNVYGSTELHNHVASVGLSSSISTGPTGSLAPSGQHISGGGVSTFSYGFVIARVSSSGLVRGHLRASGSGTNKRLSVCVRGYRDFRLD